MGRLTGIDTVLLDLDGTLYVGSQVVPGAPETVRWLRAQGLRVRFTTNTDSIPPTALADRLAGPGERAGRRSQLRGHLRRPGRRLPGSAGRGAIGRHPGQPDCAPRRRRAPGHRRVGAAAGVRHRPDRSGAGQAVAGVLHRPPERARPRGTSALVVGDELAADIGGGHAVGAATVLVHSGKGDHPSQAPGAEPDAKVDSVADLPGLLQG